MLNASRSGATCVACNRSSSSIIGNHVSQPLREEGGKWWVRLGAAPSETLIRLVGSREESREIEREIRRPRDLSDPLRRAAYTQPPLTETRKRVMIPSTTADHDHFRATVFLPPSVPRQYCAARRHARLERFA